MGEDEREVRDRLNAVLHRQMGVATPCMWACTHVIDGEWTALGAANVLARHQGLTAERDALIATTERLTAERDLLRRWLDEQLEPWREQ